MGIVKERLNMKLKMGRESCSSKSCPRGSPSPTAHLLSDGRITQRVRGEVCDSLAAGISLGMDVGGVYGNCAAREDNCDGPGKPRAAAADRPSLDMVLVYP